MNKRKPFMLGAMYWLNPNYGAREIEEDMRRIREDLATSIPEELKKRAYFVNVQRSAAIEEQRSKLPVCGMEQEIMEAINYHDVVIVCGETGSGKTTQVRLR